MPVKAQIVTAQYWHISFIASAVRDADRAELYAIGCYSPKSALVMSLATSKYAWTGLVDDVPVCMFGVTPSSVLSDCGRPWMIGTDRLEAHATIFLNRCKRVVKIMLDAYPRLENYVDERNTKAIKWLQWLKFSFDEPAPYGALQLPFMKFHMEKA